MKFYIKITILYIIIPIMIILLAIFSENNKSSTSTLVDDNTKYDQQKVLNIDELCDDSIDEETYEEDYLQEMVYACIENDSEKGISAEISRNSKIIENNLNYTIINYDELYLLSKIITWEAGSSWISDSHQLYVGNVLLNRVDSVEFPNTMYECIYQQDQYHNVNSEEFNDLVPTLQSVNNAVDLLSGNRYLPETVVFQSQFKQGSGVYHYVYDEILDTTTYFCYSSYLELYKE